jgi:hypothetical protein
MRLEQILRFVILMRWKAGHEASTLESNKTYHETNIVDPQRRDFKPQRLQDNWALDSRTCDREQRCKR